MTTMRPRSPNWATDGVIDAQMREATAGPPSSTSKWCANSSRQTKLAANPRVDFDVHGNADRIRLRVKTSSVAVSETSSRRSVGDAFTSASACSMKIRAWACEFAIEIA